MICWWSPSIWELCLLEVICEECDSVATVTLFFFTAITFANPSCRNVTYPRFALYVLGADWYNFVADPDIVYGDLDGLIGMAVYLGCTQWDWFQCACVYPQHHLHVILGRATAGGTWACVLRMTAAFSGLRSRGTRAPRCNDSNIRSGGRTFPATWWYWSRGCHDLEPCLPPKKGGLEMTWKGS